MGSEYFVMDADKIHDGGMQGLYELRGPYSADMAQLIAEDIASQGRTAKIMAVTDTFEPEEQGNGVVAGVDYPATLSRVVRAA